MASVSIMGGGATQATRPLEDQSTRSTAKGVAWTTAADLGRMA